MEINLYAVHPFKWFYKPLVQEQQDIEMIHKLAICEVL